MSVSSLFNMNIFMLCQMVIKMNSGDLHSSITEVIYTTDVKHVFKLIMSDYI